MSEPRSPGQIASAARPVPCLRAEDSQLAGREWALLLAWPWFMAACVACVLTGGPPRGHPAAVVLPAAVVALALAGVPVAVRSIPGRSWRSVATGAGGLSLATGALAVPALAGCECVRPGPGGASLSVAIAGCALLALSAYALAILRVRFPRAYPALGAAWLAAPPLLSYVLFDVLGRRAGGLLALSPASGAAWAFAGSGLAPDLSRLSCAMFVPFLAGGVLSVLPAPGRRRARS